MALRTRVTYTGFLLSEQSRAASLMYFGLSFKICRQMSRMPDSNCGNRSQTCQWIVNALCTNTISKLYWLLLPLKTIVLKEVVIEILRKAEPGQKTTVGPWYAWVSHGRSARPERGRIPPSLLHSPDILSPLKQPTQIENTNLNLFIVRFYPKWLTTNVKCERKQY